MDDQAKDKEELSRLRHSAAHLMAQAITRIYGRKVVQLGIGPVINGSRKRFEQSEDEPPKKADRTERKEIRNFSKNTLLVGGKDD